MVGGGIPNYGLLNVRPNLKTEMEYHRGEREGKKKGDTEVKSKKITSHPIIQSRIMEHKRPFHFRCDFGGAAEGL